MGIEIAQSKSGIVISQRMYTDTLENIELMNSKLFVGSLTSTRDKTKL